MLENSKKVFKITKKLPRYPKWMFTWSTTLKKVNVLRKGTKRPSKKTEEYFLAFPRKAKKSSETFLDFGGFQLLISTSFGLKRSSN